MNEGQIERIKEIAASQREVLGHRYNALASTAGLAATLLIIATFNEKLIPLTDIVRFLVSLLLVLIPVSLGGLLVVTRRDIKQLWDLQNKIVKVDDQKTTFMTKVLGYLPEFVVSIIGICVVLIICLMWRGKFVPLTNQAATKTIQSASKPFELEALNADDVTSIKVAIASGVSLSAVPSSSSWTIPDGIDPMQISEGVSSATNDQTLFAFVQQPNMWNPLWMASGVSVFGQPGATSYLPVNFAGVIFSRDSGKTWRKMFSIPSIAPQNIHPGDLAPFNPVGMFVEKNKLWLDIADDEGGGSGEGNLVRYSSTDGQAWIKQPGCFYFMPELYYDLSNLPDTYTNYNYAPIRPHNVKTTTCPAYVSQLP